MPYAPIALIIFAILALASPSALAIVRTWTGGGPNANWSAPGNWSPNGAPANGDTLVFPGGAARLVNTNNLTLSLDSIVFTGASGNYVLWGLGVTVTNGVNASHTANANTIELPLTLGANEAFTTATAGGTLTFGTNVNLNGRNLTVDADATITLSGIISGTGNLINNGSGVVVISGAEPNTYVGDTDVNVFQLHLNKITGPAVRGDVSVDGGLILLNDHQIPDSSDLFVTGIVNLNNQNEAIGALSLSSATVLTGIGTLTLGGNVTNLASASISTISGNLSLGSAARTFGVANGSASPDLEISATISGGFLVGFTKAGVGTLELSGNNTYSGATTVNAGTVLVATDTAFGSTLGGVTVNGNATMQLTGVDVGLEPLTLNAPSSMSAALTASGVSSWSGPVTLNTNVTVTTGGTLAFSNSIAGVGGITLASANANALFRFAGTNSNTYTGPTVLSDGTLELAKTANALAIGAGSLQVGDGDNTDTVLHLGPFQLATIPITFMDSGILNLNDFNDTVGALTFSGGTVTTGTGVITPGNITVNANAATALINGFLSLSTTRTWTVADGASGCDLTVNATVSGSGGVIKNGAGTVCLESSNAFSGPLTINAGVVSADNDFALGTSTAGTTVNSGAALFLDFGVNDTSEPLTLSGSGPASDGALQLQGTLNVNTNIVLNGDTVINALVNALVTIDGTISGAFDLTKIGPGRLTLAGSAANTYGGNTLVLAGTLGLNKPFLTTAVLGNLQIGDGSTNATVLFFNDHQLSSTLVTIKPDGKLDLNGQAEAITTLDMTGGMVTNFGAATLNVLGNIFATSASSEPAWIYSALTFNAGTHQLNVSNGPVLGDLVLEGPISGAGALTKNGAGWVYVQGTNTYSGLTTIAAGFYQIINDQALGSTNAGTVVQPGAMLVLSGSISVTNETLTIGGISPVGYALESISGSNWWSGNITLSSNTVIATISGSTLNLAGSIIGSSDITKQETGTLIFSGGTANSFNDLILNSGTTRFEKTIANAAGPSDITIGDGAGTDTLQLGNDNQIADTAKIHIASSGRFDLNDNQETTGAIDGAGQIDLGSGILREGADNGSSTHSGLIIGTGSILKLGAGTWTLNGNNTYTGSTTVSAGTLIVNGSQARSDVTVNGTANLGGAGVIGDLQVFGNLRPGTSPGVLTTSNINFASQGDFFVELNGSTSGTGYDQLNVRGTNNLGSATLHLSVGAGFAPSEGDEFVILNNDGAEAIVGTFNGLPNNSIVTVGAMQFRIRYSDAFGNDVVLTFTNTSARFTSATVTSGNGDGNVDVNECNLLSVVVTNISGGTLTGVSGTLISKTPGVSVTEDTAAYPNLAAGARGTNSTPFQFSTSPGFVCGTNLDFELVLQTAANGTLIIPFSLPSGSAGSSVRFNNNTVMAIPDGGSVDSLIAVSGITTPIKRVTVSLHITHTADSDLDISLVAPDGTIINLSSDNGLTASDYGTDCTDASRTTFNDAAATAITSSTAPFVGSFRPEQPLSVLNEKFGAAVNGTWRLRVADDTAGAVGSLRCWSLLISPTACTDGGGACQSCPEDTVIRGTLGNGSQVQTNRLFRDATASDCAAAKSCPGLSGGVTNRFYDAYIFENGESNACITVTLEAGCDLFASAYTNIYHPTNLCLTYLADAGESLGGGGTNSFSFNAGPGARFVVVVNAVSFGAGCDYTLRVNGGSCRPVLNIVPLTANRVALDWSTAAIGYNLLQTNRLPLAPNLNWIPVTPAPVIFNGRYRVTNTMNPSNSFYELRKP